MSTATALRSGYSSVPPPAGETAPRRDPSPAPPYLSKKQRAAQLELIWRRLVIDPVGEKPTTPTAIAAWTLDAKVRGTLNFLSVVKTLDEHAKDGEPALQPFPVCAACAKDPERNEDVVLLGEPPFLVGVCRAHGRRHKPYFRPLTVAWHESEIVNFEKLSRQILGSWWAVAVHLQLLLARGGQLVGFQSSNLPKARELLTRAEIMYKSLPVELQRFGPMSDAPKAKARKVEDELAVTHVDAAGYATKSRIIALPCGGQAVRMFTLSALFIDECQHWEVDEDFEDSYGAGLACAKGGGRLVTVSSVGKRPEAYHHRLCSGMVA